MPICEHARCTTRATVKTRFGQGFYKAGGHVARQTFVHYCDPHLQHADRLFNLCDTQTISETRAQDRGERNIEIVVALSRGETVGNVARQYGLTYARIVQIKKSLVLG